MLRKVMFSLFALCLLSSGLAARCLNELQVGVDEAALSEVASGIDAARYVQRAVDLLEPVLPQLQTADVPDDVPAEAEAAVQFLAERRLLPPGWQAETLEPDTWQTMLERVARWYDVAAPSVGETPLTHQILLTDLAALIDAAAEKIDPVALVAWGDDKEQVVFWALIRNDSIYPRMIVLRPPGEELTLEDGIGELLSHLATCVTTVEDYVSAPAETAQRLFLANNEARMIVAQTEPASAENFAYVPVGEEADYFSFASPVLAEVVRYAALFEGSSVPVMTMLRIIPQLRTNMNPREIIDFVTVD